MAKNDLKEFYTDFIKPTPYVLLGLLWCLSMGFVVMMLMALIVCMVQGVFNG